ncbi:MAG: transposase [Sandaracinaceae bacterium]|nr:transposase [Sandaracinaceae bacterium]
MADELPRWLAAVEPTLLPSDPLTAFIDDPNVPIDNSPTEREFQNVAKLRLNMLFAGSTEGRPPRLRPARHRRHLPRHRGARAGVPHLGLRAAGHPPRRLRARRGGHDARCVQARRLVRVPPTPGSQCGEHGVRSRASRRR